MINYQQFLQPNRSMLIAPAGYGKTYTIAECLKHTTGTQLILTHTHAGIASIKAKLKFAGIPSSSYSVETITSFAQKYVTAFFNGDIPEQSKTKEYYAFLIDKGFDILQLKPVKRIIQSSYSGLFVDEYQDCTLLQHCLILALSDILPTRILGDHLQGIFNFTGPLVDLTDRQHMGDFLDSSITLTTPWRWQTNDGNKELGESLKFIRDVLLSSQPLTINSYPGIEFYNVKEVDLYDSRTDYYKKVSELINREKNILILHPEGKNIEPRIKFLQSFQNRLALLESIDAKDLYEIATSLDSLDRDNPTPQLINILGRIFIQSSINLWFGADRVRRKQDQADQQSLAPVALLISTLEQNFSFETAEKIFKAVSKLPNVKCYRRDLLNSICIALLNAHTQSETVLFSMQSHRNIVRRVGRSVIGKCLGTTLLTKGLEFETVVLINAHKFENKEHLYVALTRASKRLVVFANSEVLSPYPKPVISNPSPTLFD